MNPDFWARYFEAMNARIELSLHLGQLEHAGTVTFEDFARETGVQS